MRYLQNIFQRTFLACTFSFPISDLVMFSWDFSFLKLCMHIHAHKTNLHVHKMTFEKKASGRFVAGLFRSTYKKLFRSEPEICVIDSFFQPT